MHEELWAGPELKLEHVRFHYFELAHAIDSPRYGPNEVAQMTLQGPIVSNQWQRRFFAHFDALLMTAHSIPEIIQCCFGRDGNWPLKTWYDSLDPAEQSRREEFKRQFAPAFERFRALPLSETRHVIEHRTGIAPIAITVSSPLGIIHIGVPTKRVPDSVVRGALEPAMPSTVEPVPVPPPLYSDFKIDGKPLFEAVRGYVDEASQLVQSARKVCERVHGSNALAPPPP